MFGLALAKPREREWPVLIPGKYIEEYFNDKLIGHCETLDSGASGKWHQTIYHCQMEANYLTKIMSCHVFKRKLTITTLSVT